MTDVFGILFLAVVVPLWIIFHYAAKMKQAKSLSPENEDMLSDVWENTRRMEERIETLERILDADTPKWRRSA